MPSKKLTYSDIQDRYGHQIECLSYDRDYETVFSKLDWQCKYGHQFTDSTFSLRYKEIYCPICRNIDKIRKRKQLADKLLHECHKYAKSNGGKCLTEQINNSRSTLRWKCAYNHEWDMTYEYMKNRPKGDWCPVCNRENEGNCKFSTYQRIVIAKVSSMLRGHGYTLENISSALSITLHDLDYCYSRYKSNEQESVLKPKELQTINKKIESEYKKAIAFIESSNINEVSKELYYKIAASSVAKKLNAENIPITKISTALDINENALYYWVKAILPRYEDQADIINHNDVEKHKKDMLLKTKHLRVNITDPLSDIEKLKKSIEFKVAIVSIIRKYSGDQCLTKADITRCFNIQWSTLSRWEKIISHKIRLGEISLDKHNQALQATIEEHLLSSADTQGA